MIAGYDTTATVLSALFYYVLGDQAIYARLQEEIDLYFRASEGKSRLDSSSLAELPYLNAVMLVVIFARHQHSNILLILQKRSAASRLSSECLATRHNT